MQNVIELWKSMPRSEKLNAIFMPPAFLMLFWGIWTITPA